MAVGVAGARRAVLRADVGLTRACSRRAGIGAKLRSGGTFPERAKERRLVRARA